MSRLGDMLRRFVAAANTPTTSGGPGAGGHYVTHAEVRRMIREYVTVRDLPAEPPAPRIDDRA